jgi:hypothetical protein
MGISDKMPIELKDTAEDLAAATARFLAHHCPGCVRDLSRAGVIEGPQGDRCIDLQCPLCGLWWNWALPPIAKVINLLRYEGA